MGSNPGLLSGSRNQDFGVWARSGSEVRDKGQGRERVRDWVCVLGQGPDTEGKRVGLRPRESI